MYKNIHPNLVLILKKFSAKITKYQHFTTIVNKMLHLSTILTT